ncbi:MAG TPA: hypothetical protein VF622_05680 [Segetibacter sp.]
MWSEENKWDIEVIKRRFQNEYEVAISFKQAELIYKQENHVSSTKHYFSVWEEADFELSYLEEILDSSQLKRFSDFKKEGVKRFEEGLLEQDKDIVPQLNVSKDVFTYYKEKLLPSLFDDYNLFLFGDFERSKINYLKAEYKKYLENRKKEIYLGHFRNSRTFQPNLLKLSLLNHQLSCLFPDYYLFQEHMDEPTKFIRNYLIDKLKYYSYSIDKKLKAILQEFRDFNVEVGKRHLGEVRGWHTEYTPSEEQEKEYRLMCMVLLDQNQYGC